MKPRQALALICILVAGMAWPAHADVGVPMLAVMWPPAWLLLLVIVPIEGYFARRIMSLDWRSALGVSLRANLASTLVGIPLTWLLLVLVELGTGYAAYLLKFDQANVPLGVQRAVAITVLAPWLGPGDWGAWIVPAAAAYLCIPFFFVSVLIESRVAVRRLGPLEAPLVRRWSWYANGFSYATIFAFLVAWALGSAFSHRG